MHTRTVVFTLLILLVGAYLYSLHYKSKLSSHIGGTYTVEFDKGLYVLLFSNQVYSNLTLQEIEDDIAWFTDSSNVFLSQNPEEQINSRIEKTRPPFTNEWVHYRNDEFGVSVTEINALYEGKEVIWRNSHE
jgi:hypothetical protein